MASVTKRSDGFEFSGLSGTGMRLVNNFQRQHPELCLPSAEPSYRFIRQGSLEQSLLLGRLVADFRELDPEPRPETRTRRQWHAQ